jgi:K+-transporting ATPase KdpF subunit
MGILLGIGALVSVVVLIYLFIALLSPERFQ